ncbi:crossover junction endodeoxyribonuclease RuvC [Paenibacillus sp. Dod16]|uniref:crossover junction endodeoxyribonuclease RuvC n=1 Tax=Paenibacillus sp. Dod16 TaxID=3416392 RepID=UPI003CE72568
MTRYVGIDPSGETGIALIDMHGNYLDGLEIAPEIENKTVKICEIVEGIFDNLEADDVVAIEGFSYGSKGQGIDFQFGLGHAIRLELYRQDMKWIEVAPTQVKKYATGNHQASKNNMVLPIYKHWGFEHNSDNVRDAFVLAQIARATQILTVGTKYQEEVIQAILDPKPKKKKKA